MRLRPLLACLILPLAGCVSMGATDALLTPVGIVGVHSFAPPRASPNDTDSAAPEPTLTASTDR